MDAQSAALGQAVRARVGDDAWGWLTEIAAGRAGSWQEDVCNAYTAMPSRAGRVPFVLSDDERSALARHDFSQWTIEDAARTTLLVMTAGHMPADRFVHTALECFERGDAREQQSWLRGLRFLPQAERFLPCAIDACRTNIVPLFESIACENPYPSQYFPERNFNQMVLKALFNDVALARIAGLQQRSNRDLARMAADYAAERRAAGRRVPADIGLAMEAA